MDHFQFPRNRGRMDRPDVTGIAGAVGHGRYVVLYVKTDDNRIGQAGFECHGCGVTVACASALTELITNRSFDECRRLNTIDLVNALDGVPADRGDCPEFAMHALHDVLQQVSTKSGSAGEIVT